MPATTFRDLKAWQKAHAVVKAVYRLSTSFPKYELFGLTSQSRGAARSIAANIAEGFGRRMPRDKTRFYNISQGSIEELRYYLIPAVDLQYFDSSVPLESALDEVARMLRSLIRTRSRVIPRRGAAGAELPPLP